MQNERINIQFSGKGSRVEPGGKAMDVVIPVGYISLEDLLSHIQYQIGAGTALTDELERLLAEEHAAGKRELAEQHDNLLDRERYVSTPNMADAHRILVAENIGYPA